MKLKQEETQEIKLEETMFCVIVTDKKLGTSYGITTDHPWLYVDNDTKALLMQQRY